MQLVEGAEYVGPGNQGKAFGFSPEGKGNWNHWRVWSKGPTRSNWTVKKSLPFLC